jgi:hypothetical protein
VARIIPGIARRQEPAGGAAATRTDSRFARKAAPGDTGGFVV